MMTRYMLFLVLVLTAACRTVAPPPAGDAEDCEWVKPEGEPSQFTLANQIVSGVTIMEPLECKWGSQYIQLKGSGHRQLVLAQELTTSQKMCRQAPKADEQCPQVQVDFFVTGAWHKLSDAGIYTVGAGRGPCGDVEGGYDEWNFSVGISDWARAEEAVTIVAGEMERWKIGNHIGVAVRNAFCGTPDTE